MLVLLPLLACALAAPVLTDKHKTKVRVFSLGDSSTGSEPSHFAVSVKRVDTLVDDGHPVAAKVATVLLKFDVEANETDHSLTLNDQPVEMVPLI